MDYNLLSDETLISEIRKGDYSAQDVLLSRYFGTVKYISYAFFIAGSDSEDVIQEGMIGLYKAIKEFDETKSPKFGVYAKLCILTQIYTAVRLSRGKKHSPLNTYTTLSNADFASPVSQNPEDIVISMENERRIKTLFESILSPLERDVLKLSIDGLSYAEIAEKIGKTAKSVDNAIQRIRRKLEKSIKNVE